MTPTAMPPRWYANPRARGWTDGTRIPAVQQFHQSLPGYTPTRLTQLPDLAGELGVRSVVVKDESTRLGLPAFKVLGASWAVAQVVAARTGADLDLVSLRRAGANSGLRLTTATDGNHGRAVAHMARLLGLTATVFVPAVMTRAAVEAIASEGAAVVRTDLDYDDTVMAAAAFARDEPDVELVQDTAWDGYTTVPAWIVQGYDTMLAEIDAQLGTPPTLVAVPVGVGSLAQAVVSHYRRPGAPHPAILAVEPDTAACVLASLETGGPVSVDTGATVMAGLNCGTVSSVAWPVLRDGCDAAVAVSDEAARQATVDLQRLGVDSGPSGAATLAGARAALGDHARRQVLGVTADSTVVLLSTEGATS